MLVNPLLINLALIFFLISSLSLNGSLRIICELQLVSILDHTSITSSESFLKLLNEPNVNKDFLEKNLYGTPHIAGHSQYARYQMTKMASEHIDNFLETNSTQKKNILENKIINFNKKVFDEDIKEFGLPVSLMLDTYNPKLDHFKSTDFKKIRDNYNNRIGYSQIIVKGCENHADRIYLEVLGFTVQDSQK